MEQLNAFSLPNIRHSKLKRAIQETHLAINQAAMPIKNCIGFWYADMGLNWVVEKSKLDPVQLMSELDESGFILCLTPEEVQLRFNKLEAALLQFNRSINELTQDLITEDSNKLSDRTNELKLKLILEQLNGADPAEVSTPNLKKLIPDEHMQAWKNRTQLAKDDYKLQINDDEVWNLRTQQVERRAP